MPAAAPAPDRPEPCQSCRQAPALRRLGLNLAGAEASLLLCPACAERLGLNPVDSELPLAASDLFAPLLDQRAWLERDRRRCPSCQTAFASIRRTGLVGCMRCYESFGADIRRLLPRLGGRAVHDGGLPARLDNWRQVLGPLASAAAAAPEPGPAGIPGAGTRPLSPEIRAALATALGLSAGGSEGWRLAAITDEPLVVAASLTMYRNAMDFAFPRRLSKLDGMRLLAMAERFFRAQGLPGHAGDGLRRQFEAVDGTLGCELNGTDHFRLWRRGFGTDWNAGLAGLRELETALERVTPFAVNLEWGHLSASLANLGTALRAGVQLHLPSLAGQAAPPPAIARLVPDGLSLEPTGLAGVWLLSNRRTLGWSELLIFAELAQTTALLLHYEETVARHGLGTDPDGAGDRLWRLAGSLARCRLMTAAELAKCLAELRQGLLAGVFDADDGSGAPAHWQLNALLQLAQAGGLADGDRAALVRAVLGCAV